MTLNQSVVNTNWNQFGPVYKAYFNQDKNKFKVLFNLHHRLNMNRIWWLLVFSILFWLSFSWSWSSIYWFTIQTSNRSSSSLSL